MLGNKLLQGDLVYLTATTIDNAEQLAAWFNDLDVSYWSNFHVRLANADQQRARLQKGKESGIVIFGIYTHESDQFIGVCTLEPPHWRTRKSEMGITIGDKAYWGNGYGSDATRVLLRYAFLELNLNRVYLGVFSYNTRAIRAYEKIGFVHEGSRREIVFRDGHYYDMFMMAMLRHEWDTRYGTAND